MQRILTERRARGGQRAHSGSANTSEPFDHVLIDEYQDLTECELSVLRQLAARGALIFGAGDDDQAVYGWRKATPDGIRRFEADYGAGSFVRLVECQRCDRDIVTLASRVIALDRERIEKEVRPVSRLVGEIVCHGFRGDKTEATGVAGTDPRNRPWYRPRGAFVLPG